MQVHWSEHAALRIRERFGEGAIDVPYHAIKKAAKLSDKGIQFKVRRSAATFCCKRTTERDIVIMTVLYT